MAFEAKISSDVDEVVRALRIMEHTLPGQLHDEAVQHADELHDLAQRKALELPARGREHTGIRRRMSRSVRSRRTPFGAEVVSESRPEDERVFQGFDQPVRGWWHPVPNSRNVHQFPGNSEGWFRKPLTSDRQNDELERSGANAVERALKRI